MGDDQREQRRQELKQAQNKLKNSNVSFICDNPEDTLALVRVINAIRHDGYQLFKLAQFVDDLNDLAQKNHANENYIKALEDVAKAARGAC